MTGRMSKVVIHSDGGAQPNPGVGAWAAVLRHSKGSKELVGGELGTTNNRMELTAAIQALEALTKPCIVEFHTDSEYVRNGITTWIKAWKKSGWKRGTKPVKNGDLWRRLDAAASRHQIEWNWVKGHAGVHDNERADQLCAAEIERLLRTSTPAQRQSALDAEAKRQWDEHGRFTGVQAPKPRKSGFDLFHDPDREE